MLLLLVGILCSAGNAATEEGGRLRPSEQAGIARTRTYLEQKRYAAAEEVLRPLLERERHHPLVDFYRALVAQYQEDYATACPWFERSVGGDPTLYAGWINLAQCRFNLREYAAAARAFERAFALAEHPEPRWRYNAALAWYQDRKPERARELLQRLLEDFPDAIALQWRELLVHIYMHEGGERNQRLALKQVEILARESSASARQRWREYLIHLYLQLDMADTALEYVDALLEDEILAVRWWRIAAHIHLEQQHYTRALVALQVVGFLDPGDAREERLRADLCLKLGIPVQAITYLSDLLEMASTTDDDSEVLLLLAQAYLQRHEPRRALAYLEQIDTGKEEVTHLRVRAQILYMLKDYAKAYTAYAELADRVQEGGNNARAWLFAGYAAWNAGELEAARDALKHAAREPEFSRQAQQLLQHLRDLEKRQEETTSEQIPARAAP
jgi:tetratricopeptide (TPR) repeat protein